MASAGQVIRRSLLSSPELHVLAVDDSLVDRKVIEKLLKSFSCKVTAVDSGRRALQYLGLMEGDNNIDDGLKKVNLIMTDYSMPGMTGYDLLKKIKGSSACKDIPVVIMSSETILARIDRCLEEGAQDFLEKPVKLSDIQRLTTILTTHHPDDDDEEEEDDDSSSDQGTTNKRKKPVHTDVDDVDDDDSSDQAAAKRSKRIYK